MPFNALTPPLISLNLPGLTPSQVMPLQENSKIPGPQLARVVHDNDRKFTGYAFARNHGVLGIKDVPTTSRNPQSNAICEHMHQIIVAMLKTLLLSCPPLMP